MRFVDIESKEFLEKIELNFGPTVRPLLKKILSEAPIVDAVPVVRCEKCACFEEATEKDSGKPLGYGRCRRPFGLTGIISADDFCSYGDRRSE